MKISELSDKEILDFLMTSEFEGDWSPMELKFLLVKWRYFYRSIYSIGDRDRVYLEGEIKKLNEQCEYALAIKTELKTKIADRDNVINSLKQRTLTFKERWTGKIILKENEN
jgi:hypothetical protein